MIAQFWIGNERYHIEYKRWRQSAIIAVSFGHISEDCLPWVPAADGGEQAVATATRSPGADDSPAKEGPSRAPNVEGFNNGLGPRMVVAKKPRRN